MNYNIEFGGGLGDVIWQMYVRGKYSFLEHLNPEDRVRIDLVCHNPFVEELFEWHPKRSQLDVHWHGYWHPIDEHKKKKELSLSFTESYPSNNSATPINIYCPPKDLEFISHYAPKSYIVLFPSAGDLERCIPVHILDRIVEIIRLPILIVGRYYPMNKITFPTYPPPHVVNLVDQLTVPGTLELVKRSKGIISSHSSLILYAWCIRHPNLLLYPWGIGETQIKVNSQCAFGKNYAESIHGSFEEFNDNIVNKFLTKLI